MAYDAPLIGLNALLKIHHLVVDIFGALSRSSRLCCDIGMCPTEK